MANDADKEREARLIQHGMYTVGGVVICIFLMLTTCTMHSNIYTPEEVAAKAKQSEEDTKAKILLNEAAHKNEMERLRLVEELITKEKVDPIAARCAVQGWNEKNSDVCLQLVKPKQEPKHEDVQHQ